MSYISDTSSAVGALFGGKEVKEHFSMLKDIYEGKSDG